MTLTPSQISAIRRVLDELADADAYRYGWTDTSHSLHARVWHLADAAFTAVDMATHQETGLRAPQVVDEQRQLLQLAYIRRRINIEIDRLEERSIDVRED